MAVAVSRSGHGWWGRWEKVSGVVETHKGAVGSEEKAAAAVTKWEVDGGGWKIYDEKCQLRPEKRERPRAMAEKTLSVPLLEYKLGDPTFTFPAVGEESVRVWWVGKQ